MNKEIYVVEIWTQTAGDNFSEYYSDVVHLTQHLGRAVRFCKSHLDYGGKPGMYDYYPWHFRIFRRILDEDNCCTVGNTMDLVETIYPE